MGAGQAGGVRADVVVMGGGRSALRVVDFIELGELTTRLGARLSPTEGEECKENYTAIVNRITPQ